MGNFKFTSNRGPFLRKNEAFKEMVLGHMAMDIEVAIKSKAGMPVKTGAMKSEVRHFKTENNKWRVESDKAYSSVQEAGIRKTGPGAPTRRFKNYTTAGTGAGWFARAIDMTFKNKDHYIQEAKRAVGL
jgi:hypothetical protein